MALSGLGLVPQGAGHPFPILAMFAFSTSAHAGTSFFLAFSFQLPYFCLFVPLSGETCPRVILGET